VLAETASLYLEIAEKKATLVDADDAQRRLEAFQTFAEHALLRRARGQAQVMWIAFLGVPAAPRRGAEHRCLARQAGI
jgi:hypothetical protein